MNQWDEPLFDVVGGLFLGHANRHNMVERQTQVLSDSCTGLTNTVFIGTFGILNVVGWLPFPQGTQAVNLSDYYENDRESLILALFLKVAADSVQLPDISLRGIGSHPL